MSRTRTDRPAAADATEPTSAQPDETTDATQTDTLPSVESYRSADVKGKAAIRKAVRQTLHDAVEALDLAAAKAAQDRLAQFSTPADKVAERPDYERLTAERIVTLRNALTRLESGQATYPEGVEIDAEKVSSILAGGDESLVREDAITELSTIKVRTSVTRRDLGAHIAAVAALHPSGTVLTIAQVSGTPTEVYGQERPSDGAVAARLFAENGCTIPGVSAVEKTDKTPRGMRVL